MLHHIPTNIPASKVWKEAKYESKTTVKAGIGGTPAVSYLGNKVAGAFYHPGEFPRKTEQEYAPFQR
jgi:hypothetical protein